MHDEPSIEVRREIILQWRLGARAAAAIARVASSYKSRIEVSHAGGTGDAKCIMDVMMLSAEARPEDVGGIHLKAGAKIGIVACGADAIAAVEAIESEFLNPGLDFDRQDELALEALTQGDIEFIDTTIISGARPHWQKVAMVVDRTVEKLKDKYPQLFYLCYKRRIQALAAQGRLESQGDLENMRFSEVRLPD